MTSEWNHSTISDVCVLVTDGSHSSPKSVNDGEYMVSVKDFTDYGFDFTSCRMISHDDYEILKKNGCVPQIDDILIGKDGARFFDDIIIYRQEKSRHCFRLLLFCGAINQRYCLTSFITPCVHHHLGRTSKTTMAPDQRFHVSF